MSGSRTRFNHEDCSVSRAVDVIGEPWTLLILRDLFLGATRFDHFARHLAISPKVLTNRLQQLVANGIVTRESDPDDGRAVRYRLSAKGRDLYPVIVGLSQWGDRWEPKETGPRISLVEKRTNAPVQGAAVVAEDGHFLDPREVRVELGPSSGEVIRNLKEEIARSDSK